MESLNRFFLRGAKSAISETRWFRSAPADAQAVATFKILGVEEREFRGMVSRATRPTLIIECRCGQFVGQFAMAIDAGEVFLIGELEQAELV